MTDRCRYKESLVHRMQVVGLGINERPRTRRGLVAADCSYPGELVDADMDVSTSVLVLASPLHFGL